MTHENDNKDKLNSTTRKTSERIVAHDRKALIRPQKYGTLFTVTNEKKRGSCKQEVESTFTLSPPLLQQAPSRDEDAVGYHRHICTACVPSCFTFQTTSKPTEAAGTSSARPSAGFHLAAEPESFSRHATRPRHARYCCREPSFASAGSLSLQMRR